MWLTVIQYASIGVASLGLVFVGVVARTLVQANDFPSKRRLCSSSKKLNGKTVLITGSNTGIGYATAKDFALRGARVIMACRNVQKAEKAKSKIVAEAGNKKVDIVVMQCDVADLESVQNFCKSFLAKESALHILVNNAGIGFGQGFTKQQFDLLVGTNYVGPFLLTYLLLDLIKKSASSRIVNVSSCRHYKGTLDFKPVDDEGVKLPGMTGYGTSKLLQVMHARELAKRLKNGDTQAFSVHPGYVFGGVFQNQLDPTHYMYYVMRMFRSKPWSLSIEEGAQTSIYCALEDSIVKDSGKYFDNCKMKTPNKLALDDELCDRVWDITMEAVKDYTKMLSE